MSVQPVALEDISDSKQSETERTLLPRNMELVRGVPVSLSLRAGRVSMSIEELFALRSGDVLTLDAHIDEPLMLYLEDRPVARGTLMAVDDHFGIQISEIL